MIRPITAVLALFLTFDMAAAQAPTPSLRASVTVTGDVVRIGDLIENAGPVANVPIFRAPDIGTTGTVATSRIVDAIRPHQLIGIDTHGLADVVVTRASRTITIREVSDVIAQALATQYGIADAHNILVSFDSEVHMLQAETNAGGALQVVALYFDPHTTRFDAKLDLPSSAALHQQSLHYSGTAVETVDAIGIDHPIERSETLKASDLVVLRRPKTEPNLVTDRNAVIGMAARHAIRPGQPLTVADLMKPEVVQRNSSVTIIYRVPGVILTLRGQAQEPGALGDTIGVLNVESKRVLQAVVTGPDQVTVGQVATRVVENGATRSE
jgi:flagella basal body P-ring formation protein FlgA